MYKTLPCVASNCHWCGAHSFLSQFAFNIKQILDLSEQLINCSDPFDWQKTTEIQWTIKAVNLTEDSEAFHDSKSQSLNENAFKRSLFTLNVFIWITVSILHCIVFFDHQVIDIDQYYWALLDKNKCSTKTKRVVDYAQKLCTIFNRSRNWSVKIESTKQLRSCVWTNSALICPRTFLTTETFSTSLKRVCPNFYHREPLTSTA